MSCNNHYIEAFYFVVMTQTTVGYGIIYSQLTVGEMFYMMWVQFFGLALFSTITSEVFDYKTEVSVDKMIEKQSGEMEDLLFKLSRQFDVKKASVALRKKTVGLEDEVFTGSRGSSYH